MQRAYVSLRDKILTGAYTVGEPLREELVAESLGISRTPVREALRRLDAEGLVELSEHRGARVAGWTPQDMEEIFVLRVMLEAQAARLAACQSGDDLLTRLEELVRLMEEEVESNALGRLERITELNSRFHQAIATAGGNARLASLLAAVVQRGLVVRTFHAYSPAQLARSCRHHRELIESFAAQDPDWAEAIMKAHLYSSRHITAATTLFSPAADTSEAVLDDVDQAL